MANLKVSEMTEATSFDDGDYTMIVQANQSKKISKENILGGIESDITDINTNIGNMTNLETASTDNLVNAINSLTLKILWENSDSTVNFSAQSITLDSDDYDYLIVVWKAYKNINRLDSTFTLKGFSAYLNLASDYQVGNNYYAATFVREFSRNSDTEYYFSDCYARYGNSTDRPTSNTNIIPLKIIGGKF